MSTRKRSIAIFGNTNNYPLLLAQGLKEIGHNVRLLINRKDILHRPEARYPDWSNAYPDWIVDCSNISDEDVAFETPAIDKALHHLTRRLDLVILNDIGPALTSYLKAPHAVVLTGSDLAYYADYSSLILRSGSWGRPFKRSIEGRRHLLSFSNLIARQRDGILAAELVCYSTRGLIPSGDASLDDIGVEDSRRLMLYFSNTIDLIPKPPPRNENLTILSGARIVYRPDLNPHLSAMDFKGTDVLLNGFARYIKSGGRGILRLPKKGQDLQPAATLILNLKIDEHIEWFDELPIASFYKEMSSADIICDQFGESFPGMVTTDAYALGLPIMANLRNEIFQNRFPEILPGLNATCPEEICDHLMRLEHDRSQLSQIGASGRQFAERFLSPRNMAQQFISRIGWD